MKLLTFVIEIVLYNCLIKIFRHFFRITIFRFKLFLFDSLCDQMFMYSHTEYAVEKRQGLRWVSTLFALLDWFVGFKLRLLYFDVL